ncbi:TonB-dependent receptor domain-containing protein [Shewanella waksmanii]|uniref:TonB-dependent receptor domain-containing protein n=1 Tax=Shewanella waksmanii TaxID=213783 RepID=UPI003735C8C5
MQSSLSKLSLALATASFAFPSTLIAAQSSNDAEAKVERIAVTGSRIKHDSAQMATPTTIIGAEEIAQFGVKNIAELMNKLPALMDGIGGGNTNFQNGGNTDNAGLDLANLRGLGVNRTLVLVDGRRHVAGAADTAAVNMGMIPVALIERMEIITGGASAIYGADAVTGVVNFIMKKDFDGFELDASYGQTAEGDGDKTDLSLSWGTNFNENRGNISVSASYSDQEEIAMTARDYANKNPAFATFEGQGILREDERYQALSEEGLFYVPNQDYLFDGNHAAPWGGNFPAIPITQVSGAFYPIFADDPIQPFGPNGYDTYTVDRDSGETRAFIAGKNCTTVPCDGGDGFRTSESSTLLTPNERLMVNLAGRYDINDQHRIFAEAKYGKVESAASGQASVFHDDNFGPLIPISIDNPFAPQVVVDALSAAGHTEAALAVVGMGVRSTTSRETTQFMFGGEGELGDYGYSFYLQYGQTNGDIYNQDLLLSKYYQALDAVDDGNGNAVCRDSSDGCVAFNPINNLASQEALDFVAVNLHTEEKIDQFVANFVLDGQLMELDAGPVDFAVGIEYRDESVKSTPDELTQTTQTLPDGTVVGTGQVGSTSGVNVESYSYLGVTDGGFNVAEIFAETLIPLIDNVTGIDSLELDLAARYSDNSITGGATTWKTGLNWGIVEEVRLRTTYSHAVRAPNISELFSPEEVGGGNMVDPCHADNQSKGPNPANRMANCAALGMGSDFQSSAEFGTRGIKTSGNKDLKPETADTLTVGVVFNPTPNLSFAIDYWDISIDDAITTYSATDILGNCVDGSALDDKYCRLVTRDANNQIINVATQSINVANFSASGTDIDANYRLPLAEFGELNFNLKGTYLNKRQFQTNVEFPEDVDEQAGEVGTPHIRGLFTTVYRIEDFTASWTMNYIGESDFDNDPAEGEYPEWFDNKVSAYTYHSLNLNYRANDNISVYAGVDNLTNETPPALPGLNTGSLLYDGVGRKYYAGVKIRL